MWDTKIIPHYLWGTKQKCREPNSNKWDIILKNGTTGYKSGNKFHKFFEKEKLAIISYSESNKLLNTRSEVLPKYCQAGKYLLVPLNWDMKIKPLKSHTYDPSVVLYSKQIRLTIFLSHADTYSLM